MKVLLLLSVFTLFLYADKILVINSNASVEKYNEIILAFEKSFDAPFETINIAGMSQREIKEYLYDEYPDIVYAVGIKAYQYAHKFIPEKKIFFSSIVNWKRLSLKDVKERRFGVSNELHSGMQLTLIKSVFPKIKTIGLIYSKYTQDIKEDYELQAKHLGISIVSQEVSKDSIEDVNCGETLNQVGAMLIIPDPMLLTQEKLVKRLFVVSRADKKAVFAYHELFIKYGASLVLSVDNPTIGRQIASMIKSSMEGKKIQNIQYPAGSQIIFNKKMLESMKIEFSKNISMIANKVIE